MIIVEYPKSVDTDTCRPGHATLVTVLQRTNIIGKVILVAESSYTETLYIRIICHILS